MGKKFPFNLFFIWLFLVGGETLLSADSLNPRIGLHKEYTRFVFNLKKQDGYQINISDKNVLKFSFPLQKKIDLNALQRSLPRGYKLLKTQKTKQTRTLFISLPTKMTYASSHVNNKLVIDLKSSSTPLSPSKPKNTAPVVIESYNDETTLNFIWPKSTGAAVFRRGDYVWIIFDQTSTPEIQKLSEKEKRFIEEINVFKTKDLTAYRLKTPKGVNPVVSRSQLLEEKATWSVSLQKNSLTTKKQTVMEIVGSAGIKSKLLMFYKGASKVLKFEDPTLKDGLFVVTSTLIGQGFSPENNLIDFKILPSVQGLGFVAHNDSLTMRNINDNIEIDSGLGVFVSSFSDRVTHQINSYKKNSLFHFHKWDVPDRSYDQVAQEIEKEVIKSTGHTKNKRRLDLARFYLSRAMGEEALGVLRNITNIEPDYKNKKEYTSLLGAAYVLTKRPDEALKILTDVSFVNDAEALLWSGVASAEKKDWQKAYSLSNLASVILPRYPKRLREILTLHCLEAAINMEAIDEAKILGSILYKSDLPESLFYKEMLLRASLKYAEKDFVGANKIWDIIMKKFDYGYDPPPHIEEERLRAGVLKTNSIVKKKRTSYQHAINALDSIKYIWRGDMHEANLLILLAKYHKQIGNYPQALNTIEQMLYAFPKDPDYDLFLSYISDILESLFYKGKAESLPLLTRLGIFRQFRNFIPPNHKGDAMFQWLVTDLLKADLILEASLVVDLHLEKRGNHINRDFFKLNMGEIHLANNQPKKAIQSLLNLIPENLTPTQKEKRLLFLAESYLRLKQPQKALQALKGTNSVSAQRVREDIYWELNDWKQVAKISKELLEKSLPKLPKSLFLPQKEKVAFNEDALVAAKTILNWVTALYFLEDKKTFDQVIEKYEHFMEKSPYKETLEILTLKTDHIGYQDSLYKQADLFKANFNKIENFLKKHIVE